MKKFYTILFQIFFLLSVHNATAQGFDAALLLGLNAAQLDGDGLVGYHKVGLTGGVRASYPIKERSDLGLELLYSERGSRSPISNNNGTEVIVTRLQYLEIPIFYNYKDWYQSEGDYYKVKAEGGISYGYLFRQTSNNSSLQSEIDDFNSSDISVHLALGYSVNKRMTFTGRWTSSIIDIHKFESMTSPPRIVDGIRSYYLTFRLEYNL